MYVLLIGSSTVSQKRSLNCLQLALPLATPHPRHNSPRLHNIETRLQELEKERKELAEKMDEDLLDRFEGLFASKGDSAIVGIEHGVCTGCHMKLTTATVKDAEAGKEIVNCEQCGRILYVAR